MSALRSYCLRRKLFHRGDRLLKCERAKALRGLIADMTAVARLLC